MSYPFVQAAVDLGPRSGPILGVNCHMAEGGGTVGFLSRPNRDGVSVHYVVEYSGRAVQMLLESHMQTAIRIHNTDGSYAIRQDDEPNGYGHTAAVAVLGAWADTHTTGGPNNATIGIEVEGYAGPAPANADPRANPNGGPNDAQVAALIVLIDDIRTRHPDVGLTGHRDHNVKNCPGLHFPWPSLGGHGPANGGDTVGLHVTFPAGPVDTGTLVIPSGSLALRVADGVHYAVPDSVSRPAVIANLTGPNSGAGYLVDLNGDELHFIRSGGLGLRFTPAPVADCTQAVADGRAAEHELVRAAAIKAVEAL